MSTPKVQLLLSVPESLLPIARGSGEGSIKHHKAEALGDRSVAFNDSIAGCRGYRYKAIDLANRIIYLTENEITYDENNLANILFTTEGFTDAEVTSLTEDITLPYAVGDTFTLKTRSTDYDNMGTITAINKNAVTFAEGTDLDTLTEAGVVKNDTYIDRYSFSVPAKAMLGHIVVSEDATAFGTEGTSAVGRFSFTAGRGNKAIGDVATVFGRDNIGGYGCFVAGQNSRGTGDRNYTLAHSSTNEGGQTFLTGNSNGATKEAPYGLIAGQFNQLSHKHCAVVGERNRTSADGQLIAGFANADDSNALLIIGNGEMSGNTVVARHNAFTVLKDGRAKVSAPPVDDMDVVNKGILPPLSTGTGSNSIQGPNASASGRGAFAWGLHASASASNAIVLGEDGVADAQYGFAVGRGAKAKSSYSMAFGLQVETASPTDDSQNREQIVVGRYNEILPGAKASADTSGAVFIVGVGTSATRRNGLVVWGDGRATIGKDPTENMDVVPKHMYDALVERVTALEAKLQTN